MNKLLRKILNERIIFILLLFFFGTMIYLFSIYGGNEKERKIKNFDVREQRNRCTGRLMIKSIDGISQVKKSEKEKDIFVVKVFEQELGNYLNNFNNRVLASLYPHDFFFKNKFNNEFNEKLTFAEFYGDGVGAGDRENYDGNIDKSLKNIFVAKLQKCLKDGSFENVDKGILFALPHDPSRKLDNLFIKENPVFVVKNKNTLLKNAVLDNGVFDLDQGHPFLVKIRDDSLVFKESSPYQFGLYSLFGGGYDEHAYVNEMDKNYQQIKNTGFKTLYVDSFYVKPILSCKSHWFKTSKKQFKKNGAEDFDMKCAMTSTHNHYAFTHDEKKATSHDSYVREAIKKTYKPAVKIDLVFFDGDTNFFDSFEKKEKDIRFDAALSKGELQNLVQYYQQHKKTVGMQTIEVEIVKKGSIGVFLSSLVLKRDAGKKSIKFYLNSNEKKTNIN